MTVKELKEKLAELPEGYDNCPVVSLQAVLKTRGDDTIEFDGFDDIELKRVHADVDRVRIN